MNDEELKTLLKQIDDKFKELHPLLVKAHTGLAEKVKRDTGYEFGSQIGHPEAGIDCICLMKKEHAFPNRKAARDYEREHIEPLFKELRHLYYSAFGILYAR